MNRMIVPANTQPSYRSTLTRLRALSFAVAALLCPIAEASAVTLTINPSAVPTDYTGKISITVAGLPTGKTVLLERFLDANGNGAVELPQDALTLSASITDGQTPVLGGVRNANVPGDDDGAANGGIRVDLPFPNVDGPLGTVAGRSTFKISDPQNSFTPVLAPLLVTQKQARRGDCLRPQ